MTELDIEGFPNKGTNCAKYAPMRNLDRFGLSAEQYKSIIDVYYTVSESYIHFFEENWFEDDIKETNMRILDDLQRNMLPSLSGDCFQSAEQAKEVAEYVLTLQFPADLESMKSFFNEVQSGKLEFLCHYPIGESDAKDLINSLEDLAI